MRPPVHQLSCKHSGFVRTHLINVVAASLRRGAPALLLSRQHGDTAPWLQRMRVIAIFAGAICAPVVILAQDITPTSNAGGTTEEVVLPQAEEIIVTGSNI